MNERNRIFAAAFDEMRRTQGIRTQKELALRMGVSEDTITRVLKHNGKVTEDIISKLQTASGCIFNLQWLRGESDVMLAADVKKTASEATNGLPQSPDIAAIIAVVTEAKNQTIKSMERQISTLEQQVSDKQAIISHMERQMNEMRKVIRQYDPHHPLVAFQYSMETVEHSRLKKESV